MIYVRLFGGLGNQLFQYASARAVALRRGVALGMDLRDLGGRAAHITYGLQHFAIRAEVDPPGLPPGKAGHPMAYALWRAGLWRGPRFLREKGLGVNRAVLEAPDETYLHGYFQSEAYFADAIAQIRSELAIITPPSAENSDWLARIAADPQSVSVHLRRGDYVSAAKGSATHGTCDEAYYRNGLSRIADRTGIMPRAYVFSDDPAWAAANLSLGVETLVVGHNGPLQHYEDLRLMAACRHHVIANSTFSWWGGWLDAKADRIVVAPARWFATPDLVNPDILPPDWIAL
jgi:hypothetical protein